jgi:RNA polymerase sigma factor (sigma-70 family)
METETGSQFTTVFEENKERVYRICRSFAASPADAQDLFQEIMLAVWKNLPQFKGQSHINTWVYRVTLNICLKAKAQSGKRAKLFKPLSGIQFADESQPPLNKEILLAQLESCVDQLNTSDKGVVVLFLEGLPYKEIAEVTGLTENHIAVKLKRIKNRLFNCIKNKNND